MAPRVLPILSQLDDIAEAIAEPPSRRPFAKAVGNAGRKICDRRSANPGAAGYGGFLGAAIDTMCTPYWEENDFSPPVEEVPFTGGQCVTAYTVQLIYRRNAYSCSTGELEFSDTSDRMVQTVNRIGPITFVGREVIISGSCGPRREQWNFVRSNGFQFSLAAEAAASTQRMEYSGVRINLIRQDGGSDDCGNPAPEVKPGPNPAPDPGPIPADEDAYEDPETGPMLPIPGLPSIPFRNPFGGGRPGDPPGDPGEPGDPVPADGIGDGAGGESAEGQAPPGSELVGLRLDLVSALPNFPQYGDGIYRGGAYIYMGTASGQDQDFGGSQIRDGQFFYAETEGQTKWTVTANVGISWLVTPFYREVN